MIHVSVALLLESILRLAPLPTPTQVDRLIGTARKAWSAPGVAVVIVRREKVLYLQAHGLRQLQPQQPLTVDTLFPLASCTKAFTTTLIAQLVDEQQLHWDDPPAKYLPDFHLSDRHADALLTLRDLLCHRCGLGGHDLLWYRAPWKLDEVLRRSQHLSLDYPFRGGFAYSSIPFIAAGKVLEKRTGRRWEDLLRERLCEPMGMTAVLFHSGDPLPPGVVRAVGYRREVPSGPLRVASAYPMPEANPAGSLQTTPRDLALWLQFQLNEGRAPNGRRLVSVAQLRETHRPHNLLPMSEAARRQNPETIQLCYALGWLSYDYRGQRVLAHGGLIDGFRLQLTLLPEADLACAVLCNLQDCRLPLALTNALIDLYLGLPPKDWITYYRRLDEEDEREQARRRTALLQHRDPHRPPSLPLECYSGAYDHPAYGPIHVTLQHTHDPSPRLRLRFSSFDSPLEPFAADTFRINDGFFTDQLVTFTVTNRRVTSLRFLEMNFPRRP
jgi:CubicO group peptidase (beta-lactamase class C family)